MAEHQIGAAETLLKNGEMQRVELEGKPVIVARVDDQYYAFRGTCTHYGARLDQGVLKGHEIICPWHHACFDIRNGDRVEPPALANLPYYPLRVENGQVIVNFEPVPAAQPSTNADGRTFVIVGGGAVGNAAAEELKRQGFNGRIVIVSTSSIVPIDRPNVSKDYLDGHAKPEWMPLRDEGWYTARNIELRLNAPVTAIDTQARTVMMPNDETIPYDKLLLATGAHPRKLNVPGADLENVFTLREMVDADRIIGVAKEGDSAVVVGASFIGMEAANALTNRGLKITVVGLEAVPFENILGREIGQMYQREHEAKGVQFRLSSGIDQFVGTDGKVSGVRLQSGEELPATFVLMGVGVQPTTSYLKDTGVNLNDRDQSVLVDKYLQSSDANIFAAGDIARWDNGSENGQRIEHWRTAQQHGIVAARNMLGQQEDVNGRVPFFWTVQWGLSLRYVGHASKWDEIIYRGKPEEKSFIAFYVADGKLLAAAGLGHDRELDALEFVLRDGIHLSTAEMRDEKVDLVAKSGGA